ncbi:MAG: STAS/SEC14 domain-containing protein [Balneolales bacterium]
MEVTKQKDKVVEIHVKGRISEEDYKKIIPELENEIQKHDKINLYCEIDNITGVDAGAVWHDLKFGTKHFNSFNKVAIIGHEKWIEWMSVLAKPFTTATVKIFKPEKREEAKYWLSTT